MTGRSRHCAAGTGQAPHFDGGIESLLLQRYESPGKGSAIANVGGETDAVRFHDGLDVIEALARQLSDLAIAASYALTAFSISAFPW